MLAKIWYALMGTKPTFDRGLLLCVLALLGISVVLINSASVMEAFTRFGDSAYYLKRQLVYVVLGLFVFIFCATIPTAQVQRFAMTLLLFSIALLILVLIVGREINEAKRWIELGFFNIQPAEILKLSWIIYLASYSSRKTEEIRKLTKGFLKPLFLIGFIAALLLAQPDFGSLVVVTSITFGILFVSGAGLTKFFLTGFIVALIGAALIVFQPYRWRRVMSFLDPWADEFGSGYQLTQSLMAFGRGGVHGEGIGNSIQKLGYLPEAHTDFVTAILGEELGFVGMLIVIALEFFIVFKAVRLSFALLRHAPSFAGYAAFGIGCWFALQTVINIGAATGALPTKGLTLPLVSYGGSSLMITMAALALLMRIDFEYRHGPLGPKGKKRLV